MKWWTWEFSFKVVARSTINLVLFLMQMRQSTFLKCRVFVTRRTRYAHVTRSSSVAVEGALAPASISRREKRPLWRSSHKPVANSRNQPGGVFPSVRSRVASQALSSRAASPPDASSVTPVSRHVSRAVPATRGYEHRSRALSCSQRMLIYSVLV